MKEKPRVSTVQIRNRHSFTTDDLSAAVNYPATEYWDLSRNVSRKFFRLAVSRLNRIILSLALKRGGGINSGERSLTMD